MGKIFQSCQLSIKYMIMKSRNKLAFGQTWFAAAADPIEQISEEKFLLQIFVTMANLWSKIP